MSITFSHDILYYFWNNFLCWFMTIKMHRLSSKYFMRMDTYNLESLQHIGFVIIKSGENVEPCLGENNFENL